MSDFADDSVIKIRYQNQDAYLYLLLETTPKEDYQEIIEQLTDMIGHEPATMAALFSIYIKHLF